MGKIEFSTCQDVRNQKKIQELDCPQIGRASCRERV